MKENEGNSKKMKGGIFAKFTQKPAVLTNYRKSCENARFHMLTRKTRVNKQGLITGDSKQNEGKSKKLREKRTEP